MAERDTAWLIDKSALQRLVSSPDAEEWVNRIERGLVHVTTMTLLEAGYSARSADDLRRILTEDRAIQILIALAERGQHRAPSLPNVLIGATAERSSLTVLHVDKDFDLISEVTHQSLERLVTDSA